MRELYEGLGAYVVDGGPTFNPLDLRPARRDPRGARRGGARLPQQLQRHARRRASLRALRQGGQSRQLHRPASGPGGADRARPRGRSRTTSAASTEALAGIRVGSVAPAARDDKQGRFVVGDAVGFVGEEIVAWGGAGSILRETLAPLGEGAEIITAIGGDGAPIPLEQVEAHAPDAVELEVHDGGQPHYWWLLAAQ